MQTKTKKIYSENFMNSQNYILGKGEKKKVLSKFFMERLLQLIYNKIPKIISIIYILFLISIVAIFLFIWFSLIINSFTYLLTVSIPTIIVMMILLWFFILLFIKPLAQNIFDFWKNQEILSLKNYFFVKINIWINFILWFVSLMYITPDIYKQTTFWIFFTILFFLHDDKVKTIFEKINVNFITTIFSPVFFIWIIFTWIYYYLFSNKKDFITNKQKPNSKILKKFEILEKNYAINKYYEISMKK